MPMSPVWSSNRVPRSILTPTLSVGPSRGRRATSLPSNNWNRAKATRIMYLWGSLRGGRNARPTINSSQRASIQSTGDCLRSSISRDGPRRTGFPGEFMLNLTRRSANPFRGDAGVAARVARRGGLRGRQEQFGFVEGEGSLGAGAAARTIERASDQENGRGVHARQLVEFPGGGEEITLLRSAGARNDCRWHVRRAAGLE